MPQMIIASRIGDGRVVFMAGADSWVDSIDSGVLVEDEAEGERLLAAAKDDAARAVVIEPYLIDVEVDGGERRPMSYREQIRAFGPSIRSEFREGQ